MAARATSPNARVVVTISTVPRTAAMITQIIQVSTSRSYQLPSSSKVYLPAPDRSTRPGRFPADPALWSMGTNHRDPEGRAMSASRQLSYSHGASADALLGETIGANLRRVTAAHAAAEALVDVPSGRRWTYAQLDADTDDVARGLIAAGVGQGDRVGIWAPNCAEWVLLQYGTAKMGAILVNINPSYRSHELAYVLKQAGISVLVSAESFKTSDYRGMIEAARGELPGLRQVVYIGTADWDALVAAGQQADPAALAERETALAFDDPINIQYTSGTTGFPKGATLSHHNILNKGFFIGEGCRYSPADRVCIPVPFYHCFGMVLGNLACTTHGSCIVIPAPGFDPALTLAAVAAERCTSLYGVPP